ncbi:MAG TPA: HAMP domain-containing protein [Firmicutes bacterium]|jgi:signal transduction histidine kinase|nr:HAMP domain-containing protein [Bacillota bacterium]
MRNNQQHKKVTTIGFSLGSKLNIQLWLRLFSLFLVLDLVLLGGVLVGTGYYAEQVVAEVHRTGPVVFGREMGGITVNQLTGPPEGWTVPQVFQRFLPKETANGSRLVRWDGDPDLSWWDILGTFSYHVHLKDQGLAYAFSVGRLLRVFALILAAVFALQLYSLAANIFSQSQVIRKTLQPISELAEKAQTLSQARTPFHPGEVQALAGKLEGITAAKLDTRIELESTQDELRSVASAINGLLDRINHAYQMQARFVSDASHELRTPIAAIQGYANLLDRWGKHDPEALEESIAAIKEEASNMQDLVEQLLFLARGDNNTMSLEIEPFDLGALGETIVREYQMLDEDHEYVSSFESVLVEGDQGLIKQAVRVLVDNARKYTPAGGKIKLLVKGEGRQAHITVQDEGIGIPPEVISRIFDRFFRADESRARATGGTGLGLSIAHWIADRHGGHIEVLSRENVGSRFTLVLPALPPTTESES